MASSVIMASDGQQQQQQQQPVFHDFLGMSCTDSSAALLATSKNIAGDPPEASSVGASSFHPLVCAPSGLAPAETQGVSNMGVQLHGHSSSMLNRYSGRKRSNSDSGFIGPVGVRKLPIGADSLEGAHLMKIAHNDAINNRLVRQHHEEVFLSMQPPKTVSGGSSLSQPPTNVKDFVASNLDRIIPAANAVPAANFHPRLSQYNHYGAFADKISSSVYGDSSAGPSLVTQPAADEGSRTGMKGSGLANNVTSASGAADRIPAGVTPSCSRQKPRPQITELEYDGPSSHKVLSSVNRQMTIFYGGQAHVFDDVHPKKADAIMALAGSNGRSWSTTYSSKSSRPGSLSEACKMGSDSETSGRRTLSHDLQGKPSTASAVTHGYSRGGQGSSLSAPSAIPGIQDVASDKDAKLAMVQSDTPEDQGKKDV